MVNKRKLYLYNGEQVDAYKISELTGMALTTIRWRHEFNIPMEKPYHKNALKIKYNESGERECKDCSTWSISKYTRCGKCRYIHQLNGDA